MGDRSNVVFEDASTSEPKRIWFYSHSGGKDFQVKILDVLKGLAPARFEDPSYLTRRVLAYVLESEGGKNETGMGIWTSEVLTENPYLVVSWDERNTMSISYTEDIDSSLSDREHVNIEVKSPFSDEGDSLDVTKAKIDKIKKVVTNGN